MVNWTRIQILRPTEETLNSQKTQGSFKLIEIICVYGLCLKEDIHEFE